MNTIIKVLCRAVVLLIMISTVAFAGGENRAGTSAAPELLIPIGARYLSMGGAPIGDATGIEAIFWNPAGLDRADRSANAFFSNRRFIADISINSFAVSGKFGFGTLGLSLRAYDIGDINVTTEEAPDGTGEIFNPTYFTAGLTYSRQLADRVAIGINANVVNESFGRVSATGFAFDIGVQYSNLVGINGFSTGVVVKGIGPAMQYGGSGLWVPATAQGSDRGVTFYQVQAASFDLPSVIEIGLSYRLSLDDMNTFTFAGSFQNNNYAYDEYRVGVEYSYNQVLFLRAGNNFAANVPAGQQNVFQNPKTLQNITFGVGLNFNDIGGTNVSLDYAFVPAEYFSNNHVIELRVGF